MGEEQFLRVIGEGADPGCPADELAGEPAAEGAAGEFQDFGTVEGQH
jgi:hypothetical protein